MGDDGQAAVHRQARTVLRGGAGLVPACIVPACIRPGPREGCVFALRSIYFAGFPERPASRAGPGASPPPPRGDNDPMAPPALSFPANFADPVTVDRYLS